MRSPHCVILMEATPWWCTCIHPPPTEDVQAFVTSSIRLATGLLSKVLNCAAFAGEGGGGRGCCISFCCERAVQRGKQALAAEQAHSVRSCSSEAPQHETNKQTPATPAAPDSAQLCSYHWYLQSHNARSCPCAAHAAHSHTVAAAAAAPSNQACCGASAPTWWSSSLPMPWEAL